MTSIPHAAETKSDPNPLQTPSNPTTPEPHSYPQPSQNLQHLATSQSPRNTHKPPQIPQHVHNEGKARTPEIVLENGYELRTAKREMG